MNSLKILSGGAAQGLVASVAPKFKSMTGLDIEGEFGAVGAMADKLRSGTPADIVVLTESMMADLAKERFILCASIANIGLVQTAIAVRSGDPLVSVGNAAQLRDAFLSADAIFVPDTATSTAGLHVAKVLEWLGIAETVAARLQVFPNGATAMRNLAISEAAKPIGCTQATEIINTAGVSISGALPGEYALSTIYTAGISASAANPAAAQSLTDLLIDGEQRELRVRAGFLEMR